MLQYSYLKTMYTEYFPGCWKIFISFFYGFLILSSQQVAGTYSVARRQVADSRRAYECVHLLAHVCVRMYMRAHVYACVCMCMHMYVLAAKNQ